VLGGRTAKALEKSFGMHFVRDLLAHYPRRLVERGELTDLRSLHDGEEVTVVADVRSVQSIGPRGKATQGRLEVVVSDGKGRLQLVFFGPQSWRAKELQPGRRGLFSGKVGRFRETWQLVHPEYKLLGEFGGDLEGFEVDDYAGKLIPIYPATQQVRTWQVGAAIGHALDSLDAIPDPVPIEVRARRGLPDLDTSLRDMHRPADRSDWYRARQRLKFDEALGLQLALAQRRAATRNNPARPRPPRDGKLLDAFDARLPFALTDGQLAVGDTLSSELSGEHPMHRLLQGEVGSGKTVVALRAMLQVVDNGGQAALLAPTEVLAQQHARTIEAMLGPMAQGGRLGSGDDATRVTLLTGSLPTAARRKALLEAASGEAGIVVGTHALIQQHVQFADLGLVVVDEQHRFGVEQRDALRDKAAAPPHLLVMTATPIPRTVAMTVFGDLETSTLSELPRGRSPIATSVVPVAEKPAWIERAWQRIREEVAQGRQVYVVCPRIGLDAGDLEADVPDYVDEGLQAALDARRPAVSVLELLTTLADGPLHGLRLAALHGRLPPEEKDQVMSAFVRGELDVLVATTVIEVGVDVPNATMMVIMDADRFGVSQLHQLRGRVGRGGHPGLCLLVTGMAADHPARDRLTAVAATTDGFELARLDVEQRSEGDVLGAAQSGRRRSVRLLSLLQDEEVIAAARVEATDLVAGDPLLSGHPLLAGLVAGLVDETQAEYLEKG
jgi:ATP-dependent DNA helicase RecG